jgi:hypothetical protein
MSIDLWMCQTMPRGLQMRWGFIVSFMLVVLGIVGVFVDIPFVSEYTFWLVIAGYVVPAGSRL